MRNSTNAIRLVLAAAAVGLSTAALADVQYGTTDGGYKYAMGGVGASEEARMQAESSKYSLRIVMETEGSSEYLSDVNIHVQDATGKDVFMGHLNGPRLMLQLAPGTYTIKAEYRGKAIERTTNIPAHGGRELVIHFRVRHDLLPQAEAPMT